MKKILVLLLLFLSTINAYSDTTNTLALDTRIKVSLAIVEVNEELGDFSRMSLTKTDSDAEGLQDFDIKFPVLVTPNEELTILNGSIKYGENIWKFILESIVQEGRGKLLNETFLVINNNETATIDASSKEPYRSLKVVGNTEQLIVEFLDIGTKAEVTPIIQNEQVNLELDFEISEILGGRRKSKDTIPVRSVRKITTNINLSPNEYVIIGGLDQEKIVEFINGIPYLRNIPWIGTIFTSREQSTARTKLYIMVNASQIEAEDQDRFNEIKAQNEKDMNKSFIESLR